MADVQSNIDIRIDTSSALASIKTLQAQISAFHTSMAKGTAENVVASKQLQQKLIDSINATQKFSAGIQNIKTTTESFTTALEKNKLSLGQYFKYSIAATKSFGGAFKTEMATIDKVARERVKDLQTQYIQLGRDANGAMKAIAVRPLALDLENLQTKTALAAQKQQILNQLLKQGSTNLLNFGKNTQWAGRQLMVGFTIPLSMAATAAAKAYMDIEKASIAIARVYGDLNTSNKEVVNMVSQIKQLAGEYTKYGIAIADTMQMAAKAAAMGKTGADLLTQVNQASKLAALGMVDQQMALDTTISLTNAFGTSTEQLSNKINFLNAVENQTVLSIEDMTVAIPKAAPVVKQLGGDVEDLAFFLTAMKEGGINASEGANALKSGLSALINPTKASSDFLAQFGVNVKGIVEQDKGNLKKTVVDFASALDKIDPLNRARAIEMMFGKFQFARISTLLQNVNKEGSQASKALELANMSSIQLAAISRKELDKLESSPMYKFQKAIADLQLKIAPIGETFLKAVTPIIEKVGDFLNGFNKMGDGFKQFVVVGAAVLGGLAPVLLMVVGLVANGAANIIKMFANVKAFLNRTTTESQVLGETTNYLTTEQIKAEAVAASLDQTHSKLKQTFTSETSAVIALMEAYLGANAAMSRFNVPVVPTSIGKRKKLAAGGVVQGPGGPTDDAVPADLSNGEVVLSVSTVNKNPGIVAALLQGRKLKVPGFRNDGIAGKSAGRSHAHAQLPLSQEDYPEAWAEGIKDLGLDKLPAEILSEFKMQLVGSLTAELPQSANIKLKGIKDKAGNLVGGGLKPDEWSDIFKTEGIFASTAARGGMDIKSPAAKKALAEFQERVRQNALDIAIEDGLDVIYDPQFAAATSRAMDQLGGSRGSMGELVSTLRRRAATPGQFRATSNNALLKRLDEEGLLTQDPNSPRYYTYGDTGTRVGRKRGNNNWNASLDPKKDYPDTYFGQQYMTGPATQQATFNDSAQKTAQTNSESRRTRKIAKDTVDGYANELERSKKKVSDTAKKTTQSESDYILRQLNIRKKNAEMSGAETASIEKLIAQRKLEIQATEQAIVAQQKENAAKRLAIAAQTPMPYGVQGPLLPGQKRITTVNTGRVSGAIERGLNRGAGALSNLGTGRSAGIGMAVSMGAYALAGSGGTIGNIVAPMLPLINTISMITPLLSSVLPKLVQFIPMIARFAGPVGLVITGLTTLAGAITLVTNETNKEAKAKLQSSQTVEKANSASEAAIASLAELSGVAIKKDIRSIAAAGVSSAGFKQASDVSLLLSSNEFKDKTSNVGQLVESIKKMSEAEATAFLSTYGNKLKSAGFSEENINSLMKALEVAAGKRTLNIQFKDITYGSKSGIKNLENTVTNAAIAYSSSTAAGKQAASSAATGSTIMNLASLGTFGLGTKNWEKQNTAQILKTDTNYQAMATNFKNLKTAVSSNLSSMIQQLKDGKISIGQYTVAINTLGSSLKNLSKQDMKKLVAQTLVDENGKSILGPATLGVMSFNQQLALMQMYYANPESAAKIVAEINKGGQAAAAAYKLLTGFTPEVAKKTAIDYQNVPASTGGTGGTSPKSLLDDAKKAAETSKFAGQMLQAGFGPALIDVLSSADQKTRDFYTTTKNGIVTLTAAGKELQKQLNLDALQKFKNSFAQQTSDMAKQVTFQNALVRSGMSIADAQKMAANEEQRNAYFSATNGKAKQDVLDKTKQLLKLENATKTAKQQQAEADQKALDLANAQLQKATAENKMATKQAQINEYQDALNVMSIDEDRINKTYDERSKALEKVQKAQEAIAAAQKDQLTVADALTKGDIAAAARAAQESRANAAQRSMTDQKTQLDNARQAELDALMVKVNGKLMTRKQIEQSIKDIEYDMYKIQLNTLDPINKKIAELTDQANLSSAEAKLEEPTQVIVPEITPTITDKKKKIVVADKNKKPGTPGKPVLTAAEKAKNAFVASGMSLSQYMKATVIPAHYEGSMMVPAKTIYRSNGGMIPSYFANGGMPIGTDVIPAMLTPGEFVVTKHAVKNFGVDNLRAINSGSTIGDSVYNYSLNVNMSGSNLSPDDVARTVMAQIRQVDSQRLRGNRF